MSWDRVPWFIGNGAEHSPELARLVLYASTGGAEGTIEAADLKVLPQAVAAGSVRISAGAALLLNRSAGGAQQTYGGRNPTEETVAISPTGSGGGRSDLVIARVEDPQYSPWQAPADPVTGQYIFTRVIENVPAATTSAEDLNLGYPAIALARIDIPASTSAITAAMIKDVRKIARPRRLRTTLVKLPTAVTAVGTAFADTLAFGNVDVPKWATQMILRGDVAGAVIRNATSNAEVRARLGTNYTQTTAATEEANRRVAFLAAGKMAVPSAIRGTAQPLAIQLRKSDGGDGTWQVDTFTTGVFDLEFLEEAE